MVKYVTVRGTKYYRVGRLDLTRAAYEEALERQKRNKEYERKHDLPDTRKVIQNQVYYWGSSFRMKIAAQKSAEGLRRKGFKARVVPTPPFSKPWSVYTFPKLAPGQ